MRIKIEIDTDGDGIEIIRTFDDVRTFQNPPAPANGKLAVERLRAIVDEIERMRT